MHFSLLVTYQIPPIYILIFTFIVCLPLGFRPSACTIHNATYVPMPKSPVKTINSKQYWQFGDKQSAQVDILACFTCNSNRLKEAFARRAPTDADVCTDRRRCPHRPTRMSAPTDADAHSNTGATLLKQKKYSKNAWSFHN